MLAKDRMIDLLRTTKNNEVYTFTIPGCETEARAYIHRMRVELSRMRGYVRDHGKTPAHFKIRIQSIMHNPITKNCEVTLLRSTNPLNVDDKVASVFSELSIEM